MLFYHPCIEGDTIVPMPKVRIKRIYEAATANDGTRVLVDRLWPRGLTKDAAKIDRWIKELGPSNALRAWFGHEPERWAEFSRKYRLELKDNAAQTLLRELTGIAAKKQLTLLYSAKDEAHNQAVVIAGVLNGK